MNNSSTSPHSPPRGDKNSLTKAEEANYSSLSFGGLWCMFFRKVHSLEILYITRCFMLSWLFVRCDDRDRRDDTSLLCVCVHGAAVDTSRARNWSVVQPLMWIKSCHTVWLCLGLLREIKVSYICFFYCAYRPDENVASRRPAEHPEPDRSHRYEHQRFLLALIYQTVPVANSWIQKMNYLLKYEWYLEFNCLRPTCINRC